MLIRQISVFMENRRGALRELCGALGNAGIDLLALSVADTADFGIARIIVRASQQEDAMRILSEGGYTVHINHVLCVSVPDRPSGLYEVLTILEKADIAVEYLYSIVHPTKDKALIVLRLSDNERGSALLRENGVELLCRADIETL